MKKGLKIASLALALAMALSCGMVASAEETSQEIPTPKNSKTVKANGDGTYDVSLSFEGSVTQETNIKNTTADVVLVADRSPSMNRDGKWDSLKKAVDVLSKKMLPEGTDNRASVVLFETEVIKVDFFDSYWTSSAEHLKFIFDNYAPDIGYTNSPLAIEYAEELLATARDDSKKYVIFLSDGKPNLYGEFGNGVAKRAIAAAEKLRADYPDATVYSVGVPGCDEDFMKKIPASDDNYFYADNADELANVFDGIADVITKAYSNVIISDSLSDYAEYVNYDEDGKPIFDVEVRNANGDLVDGANYDIAYDAETKTVSLDLGTEQIPDRWTYKLSYTVKPNAYADEFFAKNGYDAVGDENTDADGNATSSGKDGFKISNGKIEFTYRDERYSVDFANPVFQVEEKQESSESSEPSEPSESSEESSESSKEESSKTESSKTEPSQVESSKQEGKPANDIPQTGNTQNVVFILMAFAASAAIISVKAFKSKKSK